MKQSKLNVKVKDKESPKKKKKNKWDSDSDEDISDFSGDEFESKVSAPVVQRTTARRSAGKRVYSL